MQLKASELRKTKLWGIFLQFQSKSITFTYGWQGDSATNVCTYVEKLGIAVEKSS